MSLIKQRITKVLTDHEIEATDDLVAELIRAAKSGSAPPAVERYRLAAGRYPPKTLWDFIGEAVGDDKAALARYESTVLAWVAQGWNPANVKGQLEFFRRGELPGADGHKERENGRNYANSKAGGRTNGAGGGAAGNQVSTEGVAFARRLAGRG